MAKTRLISVAKGESPADLVLSNARVVNVFSGEVQKANVAISGRFIAGVGDYHKAKKHIDVGCRYLFPGFINGHTHLESSMLDVGQYACAVVPHGTLAVITDLHEIANVCGWTGIRYVLNCARRLPLNLFLMAPSCVPSTHLETSGAKLGPSDIKKMLLLRECIGLGEVMNYPGVLCGDKDILQKIKIAERKVVDGHAPGLSDRDLNAYIATGVGSDHESVTLDEGRKKLERGMYLMIREGSSEKNLDALLPLVTDKTYPRCMFVVDDRSCGDLLRDGDIDAVVRKAIKNGLDPITAIRMATINPATYFGLRRLGAVAPGYLANLVISRDLSDLRADMVFNQGILVAEHGEPRFDPPKGAGSVMKNTMNIKPFESGALRLLPSGEKEMVIGLVPGQILTRKRTEKVRVEGGVIVPDKNRDILKLAIFERHRATGNIGLGLVKGFGLQRGAIASSIAHDSHNVICVGASDEDILVAVKEVGRLGGGLVIAEGGCVKGSLALPVAGLLSEEPLADVVNTLERLEEYVAIMGCSQPSPFATLSFLALPVIPEIRLTDLGLVDVGSFSLMERGS